MQYVIFVAIYYSWTKYKELSSNSGNTTSTVLSVATGLDTYVNNERTWYWLSKYGFLPSCCQNTFGFCYFLLELDLLSGIKVIEVCLSVNIIIVICGMTLFFAEKRRQHLVF